MFCRFPYFKERPHIPITIKSTLGRKRFLPLLDSGADFCVFYKIDALRLGLEWSKGRPLKLSNADGTDFSAREFVLDIGIEDHELKAKVCFIDSNRIGTPLLGRQNIFDQFKILINEKENFVEFQSH